MKTTITLALILGGCNYDYAIMESPDEPSSETVVIYQQGTIPSAESSIPAPAPDTGEVTADTVAADTDTPTEDTDEPVVEDTDAVVDTGLPLEPPADTDEPPPTDTGVTVDTSPPTDPPVEPDPIPDPPPPVDTDPPVDTGSPPPPPVDPGPDWTVSYFEDFSDGQAQGWSPYSGGCGAQGVTGVPPSWLATSDWNGARVPVPTPIGDHTRLTIEAQISISTTNAVVRWLSNPVVWNSNDDGGISFYYVAGSGSGVYVGGHLTASYPVMPNIPLTLEIEDDGYEYVVSVDGVEVASGTTEGVTTMGQGLELHANGDCSSRLLNVYSVKLETASF